MTPHDPRTDHPGWARHPGVRSGPLLTTGERTADLVLRIAGTWRYLLVLAVAILLAAAAAVSHDRRAGAVVLLSLVLSAAALIEVSLVLMAGRLARIVAQTERSAIAEPPHGARRDPPSS